MDITISLKNASLLYFFFHLLLESSLDAFWPFSFPSSVSAQAADALLPHHDGLIAAVICNYFV